MPFSSSREGNASLVVYDYTKILNLKQLTTDTLRKIIIAIFSEIENQK